MILFNYDNINIYDSVDCILISRYFKCASTKGYKPKQDRKGWKSGRLVGFSSEWLKKKLQSTDV